MGETYFRDLSQNHLSGTIDAFPASMQTWILSNNQRVSGSVPIVQSSALTHLLLNGMRISGTVAVGNNSLLQTLSLAQNYLEGRLNALAAAHSLRTLIVSGNYFSVSILVPASPVSLDDVSVKLLLLMLPQISPLQNLRIPLLNSLLPKGNMADSYLPPPLSLCLSL